MPDKKDRRECLREIFEKGTSVVLEADVGFRRSNIKLGGKPAIQRVLTNIRDPEHGIEISHSIMTIGREIPAVPIVYSRVTPGMHVTFEGVATRYTDSSGQEGYGLRMLRLLDSVPRGK